MITEIGIRDVATFEDSHTIDNLKQFNYFFGGNATGKTTISRVLNDPKSFNTCYVHWKNGSELETLVYNREFVEKNFGEQEMKGVFTLGEGSKEAISQIKTLNEEIADLQKKIEKARLNLYGGENGKGKTQEMESLFHEFQEDCWRIKSKHDDKLQGGMKGYRGEKKSFAAKVLKESQNKGSSLLTQAELEERAEKVFEKDLTELDQMSKIDFKNILAFENSAILKKVVVGKKDVDLAPMIEKLHNSDWVRQGIGYYENNDRVCPFCQQNTSEAFHKSLSEYFDETFLNDMEEIAQLKKDYITEAEKVRARIDRLEASSTELLSEEQSNALLAMRNNFDERAAANVQRMEWKEKEPSRKTDLHSLSDIAEAIQEMIEALNKKIDEHNTIARNLGEEKENLTKQIWRFIVSELSQVIEKYHKEKSDIDSAIKGLDDEIKKCEAQKRIKELEKEELEKQTTSIEPTKNQINGMLESYGFKNFKLETGSVPHTYKLIRENGSDAAQTLSEGERNFLTFLYFFYLIEGSHSATGVDDDKVVVIDDPISSLDSDVLFLVSALVRDLIAKVRQKEGCVKQVFVLTHNIYFHKQVTYNSKRREKALKEETFWLVKKNEKLSNIQPCNNNPVKTSYELLWEEVRNENRNNNMIQNVLRRILENYFQLIGKCPLNEIERQFTGQKQICCRALISWLHDGSHSAFNEDHYTSNDDAMVKQYLEVFEDIFDKTGHPGHYKMMMGIE